MKTLDEIIRVVSCNGMRVMTDERVKQVAREYATEVSNQLRQDIAAKLPAEVNKDIVLNTEIKL